MTAALAAWMNGERVGTWRVERGVHRFVYDEHWLQSPRRRSLSLSMPITPARESRGPAVAHYFDNLLPDNERIRARLARRFGLRDDDAFTLLEAIGRDCVGAVQLLPGEAGPKGGDRVQAEPLDEARVAAILRAVPTGAGPGAWDEDEEPFRISIAGAQEKTGLLRLPDGRWALPRGATPTTHILKLPLGLVGGSRRVDLGDSVANEWACSRILAALGLPVARTEMARFEDQQALVVERFDRAWMDGGRWIARLPQENVHWELERIHARHWHQWAMKNGGTAAWQAMLDLVERVGAALDDVQAQLPSDFPPRTWAAIAEGMRWHAARFREGLAEAAGEPS